MAIRTRRFERGCRISLHSRFNCNQKDFVGFVTAVRMHVLSYPVMEAARESDCVGTCEPIRPTSCEGENCGPCPMGDSLAQRIHQCLSRGSPCTGTALLLPCNRSDERGLRHDHLEFQVLNAGGPTTRR